MKRVIFALLAVLVIGGGVLALVRANGFPHEEHARLFPLCTGCHEGVPTGDRASFYPTRELCAGCHNGTDQQRVDWQAPRPRASNLEFSHPAHETKEQLDCSTCHTRSGAPRMAIERRVEADRCFECHRATNHFADANCAQCHVPLSRTSLAAARVAEFPAPPSHEQPDFLREQHGDLARSNREQCQVCHTRELCATCHVDAGQRRAVQAFEPAGPDLQLPAYKARYFLPESHRAADWLEKHNEPAKQNVARCATCHTRESCATCHAASAPAPVRALPSRMAVTAPGVQVRRRAPATHSAPFFGQEHGTLAATNRQTCQSCHTRTQCEQCHNALSTGGNGSSAASHVGTRTLKRAEYHPANFLERHSAVAYNRNLECSNCHDTARFCRACHEQRGMGTTGRLQPGFHDAQPLWLLNHGKPARQGLESCASCHKQTDCMQCHSGLGSFRVSPHGPSFDARRVQQRNARLCFACHLSDPLQRGTP